MQHGIDDLGTPLHRVTFCVLDLETTGGSPAASTITEVGAATFRGGERLGTFHTLVRPGEPIAPEVRALTGISDAMVATAPPIGAVLPALLEFLGGAVLVGHNVRFDAAFLDAALGAAGRARLRLRRVDTVALARRLVADEVPDCRLATLAERFKLDHRPRHRALDDALATADLLHVLLERAAAFGVHGLDDLLAFPRLAAHPQAAKLVLTRRLPRAPGLFLLRDGRGRPLHVGRATTDVRRRVRSYFGATGGRHGGPLLRDVQSIEHVPCTSPLACAVLQVRLLHALGPRYDRRGTRWRTYRYVAVAGGPPPRLVVARTVRTGHRLHMGPLPSTAVARQVAGAIEAVVPPDRLVAALAAALAGDAGALLRPLADRVDALARAGRLAAAATARAGAAAVAEALRRQARVDALRRAGRMVVEVAGAGGAELVGGRLARAWGPGETGDGAGGTALRPPSGHDGELAALARSLRAGPVEPPPPPDAGPVPLELADELACVSAWLSRNTHRLRLVHVDGPLSSPLAGPRPRSPTPAAAATPALATASCATTA